MGGKALQLCFRVGGVDGLGWKCHRFGMFLEAVSELRKTIRKSHKLQSSRVNNSTSLRGGKVPAPAERARTSRLCLQAARGHYKGLEF